MTERQKVADLPQEEREKLIQRAADAGIKNAMIATWYVDTLEAKIAAATDKKAEEQGSDDAAPGADESQQTDGQVDDQDDESDAPADDGQKTDTTPDDTSEIDPNAEAEELDKDVEPPAPVVKTPAAPKAKVTKESKPQKVTICHICRGKVINGKCSECGFDISKR